MTTGRGSLQGNRPRLLVLTPRDPYPVVGGDLVRIHSIARELSRRFELTLLTLCETEAQLYAPLPDDGVFAQVQRVLLPPWRSWLNVLAALPTREPLQIAYYRSRAFRDAVSALAPRHDAVIAHLVRTGQYARSLRGPRVLEMTDAISMSMQRVARTRLGYFDYRRFLYAIEARRLPAYERRLAHEFELVSLNSRVDQAFLFDEADLEHILVTPNGVYPPKVVPLPPSARGRGEIAFVGQLRTLQNFDAAWFFAKEVLPLVRARRPEATFRVIGPIPRGTARRLARLPGVRVEGYVQSLPAALSTVRVAVCPARIASGMQNKLLDYFANGVPVVCSPMAAEPCSARDGEHLLLAEGPAQWAEQVLRLLDDDVLARRVAEAARNLTVERFVWSRCTAPLVDRIASLSQRRPGAAQESKPHGPQALALPDTA